MFSKSGDPLLVHGGFESPFGFCWMGLCEGRLARLYFVGPPTGVLATVPATVATLLAWPENALRHDPSTVSAFGQRIFSLSEPELAALELWIEGSAFQQKVWQALRAVPRGSTLSYGELARRIGAPRAVRAVGTAVGANRIAYVLPCHRIIRADGGIGGYRWGVGRKQALLEAEGVELK